MGIEFNPTLFGRDLKLFLNGRPGIIAWTLINWSFAALQFEKHGTLTNSMILVNVLQGLYVLDFFWNERWYLRTIDMAHDHFGFYFIWGDLVWLPFMYTLQSVYLAHNPVSLGQSTFYIILFFGLLGYVLFRWSNFQKDYFRRQPDKSKSSIWLKKCQFLTCIFKTSDGGEHTSHLLTSGWWGLARHTNYTGDLILSLCFSLGCGFANLLPYFYFIYMLILLTFRCFRDEDRCQQKYGDFWSKYCSIVKYRFLPGIY
jgi:7-dehydrocholesterol reductase